jgi:hypothetical protein
LYSTLPGFGNVFASRSMWKPIWSLSHGDRNLHCTDCILPSFAQLLHADYHPAPEHRASGGLRAVRNPLTPRYYIAAILSPGFQGVNGKDLNTVPLYTLALPNAGSAESVSARRRLRFSPSQRSASQDLYFHPSPCPGTSRRHPAPVYLHLPLLAKWGTALADRFCTS